MFCPAKHRCPDVLLFGTKHTLPLVKDICITIGEANLKASSNVRSLDVVFESSLGMTNHISAICRTAYMHLHNISRIRRYLTIDATKLLVHASRLDYGNVLLAGLPREHLNKLQSIQNMAARIITFTPRRSHITPILKELHTPPVESKILLRVFRCLDGTSPLYIENMLKRQCSAGRTLSS